MTNKKNYWLFSILLLAAAESSYGDSCCNKCKKCICPDGKGSQENIITNSLEEPLSQNQ